MQQKKTRRFTGATLFLLGLCVFCVCPASAQLPPRELPEPERPAWLKTEKELQVSVEMEMNGRPLRVILAAISRKTGLALRAQRDLEEFRVSVHTSAQPLSHLMGRIQDLFGHGTLPNEGCYWERSAEKDFPVYYTFRRRRRAYEDEQAMLDLPETRKAAWLRQLRDYGKLPAEKRRDFQTDNPYLKALAKESRSLTEPENGYPKVAAEALLTMSDAQLDELLQKGQVTLPDYAPSDATVQALQKVVPHGQGVSADFNDYNPPKGARIQLRKDSGFGWKGLYVIEVGFMKGFPRDSPTVLPLDTLEELPAKRNDEAGLAESKQADRGEEIDLLAHENAPEGKLPCASLSKALQLLAREAHLSLYAEIFPKTKSVLQITKGKPEFLLSVICNQYECHWRKVGNDYLVYSRTWAQDREADITEPQLTRWQAHFAEKRHYELPVLLEMGRLREAQWATITDILGIYGPFISLNKDYLRLAAALSDTEIKAAYRPEGLTLTGFDRERLSLLRVIFKRETIATPVCIHLTGSVNSAINDVDVSDAQGEAPGGRLAGNVNNLEMYDYPAPNVAKSPK